MSCVYIAPPLVAGYYAPASTSAKTPLIGASTTNLVVALGLIPRPGPPAVASIEGWRNVPFGTSLTDLQKRFPLLTTTVPPWSDHPETGGAILHGADELGGQKLDAYFMFDPHFAVRQIVLSNDKTYQDRDRALTVKAQMQAGLERRYGFPTHTDGRTQWVTPTGTVSLDVATESAPSKPDTYGVQVTFDPPSK